jgi:hypothetical protein
MRWTVRFVVLAWVPLILFGSFPAVSPVVTATVPMLGIRPTSSVLNSANNTLYVSSEYNGSYPPNGYAIVNVTNGNTRSVQAVGVGYNPIAIAGSFVTNKVYVANECADNGCSASSLTVIDAATLSILFPQRLPSTQSLTKSTPYSVFISLMPSDVKEWSSDALPS